MSGLESQLFEALRLYPGGSPIQSTCSQFPDRKTIPCQNYTRDGSCPYKDSCWYLHESSHPLVHWRRETPIVNPTKYKTKMCRSIMAGRVCTYGAKCQFAHSSRELKTHQFGSSRESLSWDTWRGSRMVEQSPATTHRVSEDIEDLFNSILDSHEDSRPSCEGKQSQDSLECLADYAASF